MSDGSAIVDVEAVQALLAGLADGRIEGFPAVVPDLGQGWRQAPSASFKRGSVGILCGIPTYYTAESVAKFNGWGAKRAQYALAICESIELGAIQLKAIIGMKLEIAYTFG